MDIRGGRYDQIERSASRFSAAPGERCREPPPFARDGSVDRQRVERGFDDTEALRPASPLVLRIADEDAEVELGE